MDGFWVMIGLVFIALGIEVGLSNIAKALETYFKRLL